MPLTSAISKYFYLSVLPAALLIASCRKAYNPATDSATAFTKDSLSLINVSKWFNARYNAAGLTTNSRTFSPGKLDIDWNKAESFPGQKSNYWLMTLKGQPTIGHVKYGYRKLLIAKDSSGKLYSRILEVVPDVLYYQRQKQISSKDFTGRLFIYNDTYQLLGGIIFQHGTKIGHIEPSKHPQAANPALITQSITETCYWYDSSYIDAEGVFTVHSEEVCNYAIDNDFYMDRVDGMGSGGGDALGDGGGTDAASPPPPSNLPYEDHSKINPRDYMNCFGQIANAGATMTVTLYVVEPDPGTSFNLGPNSVGHVAIGLTKTNGSQSITQTVGFYPDATGLAKLHAPSKMVDNGGIMNYNVSITYNVNATQFQQIINEIGSPPLTYDLETNNCTTFAYNTLVYAGIHPPNPYNTLLLGGPTNLGNIMSPAGIGESIRAMKGQSNVNTAGGFAPPSHGPCK